MKSNNSFKKAILLSVALCTMLMTSISTFTISTGGAVAAGLGAAAGLALISWGIAKHRKNKREREEQNKGPEEKSKKSYKATTKDNVDKKRDKKDAKRERKEDIKRKLSDDHKSVRDHKKSLHDLKKQGKASSAEASEHRSMIEKLKADITDLKKELHKAL